jgi:hypothetical protein
MKNIYYNDTFTIHGLDLRVHSQAQVAKPHDPVTWYQISESTRRTGDVTMPPWSLQRL